jgi:hypothetical protein
MKISTSGGSPSTLATFDQNALPLSAAVDANYLYWNNQGAGAFAQGSILRLSTTTSGATPVNLASGVNSNFIATDSVNVYWSDYFDGKVMTVSATSTGTTPSTLTSSQSGAYGIAVDTSYVYWANSNVGTVMRMAKTGGSPIQLASGQNYPQHIAVDASSVYWTTNGDSNVANGTVMKLVVGTNALSALATGQASPYAIALDASNVYWSNNSGTSGSVLKVSKDGSAGPTTLASGQNAPLSVAVDDTSVYWSTYSSSGTVMKVTPK